MRNYFPVHVLGFAEWCFINKHKQSFYIFVWRCLRESELLETMCQNNWIPIINSCLQCDLQNYIQHFKQHLSKYILITRYLYDLILLCWHSTLNIFSFGNSFVSLQGRWKRTNEDKKKYVINAHLSATHCVFYINHWFMSCAFVYKLEKMDRIPTCVFNSLLRPKGSWIEERHCIIKWEI